MRYWTFSLIFLLLLYLVTLKFISSQSNWLEIKDFKWLQQSYDLLLNNALYLIFFLCYYYNKKCIRKKLHLCEEAGAHLRISFWHLLMNLKNNYLLKKLLKWATKKMILIFSMLNFLKKKKNTWRCHYFTIVYQKSWWYDLQLLR